jgi:hypothetical protein
LKLLVSRAYSQTPIAKTGFNGLIDEKKTGLGLGSGVDEVRKNGSINIMPLKLVSTRWKMLSVSTPDYLKFDAKARPTLQNLLAVPQLLNRV